MTKTAKKIVLIEDSETDSFLIKRVIREHPCDQSYSIVSLQCMGDARAYLTQNNHDDIEVILLDLNLPDTIDGLDTYEQIRAMVPETPVVALTSSDNRELAMNLLNKGIEDFVCKTHILDNPDLLCRAIDFAICRHSQSQAAISKLSGELLSRTQLLSEMM
ncbi:MAG TPA: response regulator [Alphaproteobacteria bacterium]|nr:response regulator [Alphaproteobacteria bacterium]HNS43853.1 response regulator [Alphaproteobacteria bacterium]